MTFNVPILVEQQINEVLSHYPPDKKRSAALMVLHALQEHFGWISPEAIAWAAGKLELQPINLYELVTFYPMFRQQPAGQHVIKICRTLSCALGGAAELHGHFCRKLGLPAQGHGLQTSADGKFSLEYVECLASCGTAPVMMCDEKFYEAVSPQKADEILSQCGHNQKA